MEQNKIIDMNFLNRNLKTKTIVFTGGTDGMGKVAARKLHKLDATIILLARNKNKALSVISEFKNEYNNENIYYINCNLASQKSIRNAVTTIQEQFSKIDILINCAGINAGERKMTEDNLETSWAVNHLAPFLLSNLLLPNLKKATQGRIINLSSATEKYGHIKLNDLQLTKGWSTFKSYTQAKLAMIMCTIKMANDLKETNVTVNALNPGFIKTNLLRDLKGWERLVGIPYMYFFASKTEVGANRILRLALSEEFNNVSGKYIYEDNFKTPNKETLNKELVLKVWETSKKHVNI